MESTFGCVLGMRRRPQARARESASGHVTEALQWQDSQGTVTSATVCVLPGKWATRERPEPLGDMARYTDLS